MKLRTKTNNLARRNQTQNEVYMLLRTTIHQNVARNYHT
jgi:hypothetical protein